MKAGGCANLGYLAACAFPKGKTVAKPWIKWLAGPAVHACTVLEKVKSGHDMMTLHHPKYKQYLKVATAGPGRDTIAWKLCRSTQ